MLHMNCFESLDRTLRELSLAVFQANTTCHKKRFQTRCSCCCYQCIEYMFELQSSKAYRQHEAWGSSIESERDGIKQFADWFLKVVDGNSNPNEYGESDIDIPKDLLIMDTTNPLQSLIVFAYPQLLTNMNTNNLFEERAILAPTLELIEQINDYVLSLIPGEVVEYLSFDTISLCNGTRLMENHLGVSYITTTVLTRKNIWDKIFIPKMNLIPSDPSLPFKY